jgi:hypothetical protein
VKAKRVTDDGRRDGVDLSRVMPMKAGLTCKAKIEYQ